MAHIVWAVHEKITAAAGSKELSSQGSGLDRLVIKHINLRIGDLAAHALFAFPSIVKEFSEAVEVSL